MTEHTIPDQIRDVLRPDEIEEMKALRGWATGTVKLLEGGGEVNKGYADAWIELFNGDGSSSAFGGVRFMAVGPDGEYQEAYAYPAREHAEGSEPAWFVAEFDQEGVDYGDPVPR